MPDVFRRMLTYYQERGLFLLLRVASIRFLDRDVFTPLLAKLYRRWVQLRGGVVKHKGVTLAVGGDDINKGFYQKLLTGYEASETDLVDKHVTGTHDVVELGGCVGFVSCYTNAYLEAGRKHIVVEANPNMTKYIERNRDLNGCDFEVVEAAYASDRSSVSFYQHLKVLSGGTVERESKNYEAEYEVPGVSLETLTNRFGLNDFVLVCDIEGAEEDLLRNEGDILAEKCTMVIIELHGDARYETDDLILEMTEIGFELVDSDSSVYVFEAACKSG